MLEVNIDAQKIRVRGVYHARAAAGEAIAARLAGPLSGEGAGEFTRVSGCSARAEVTRALRCYVVARAGVIHANY